MVRRFGMSILTELPKSEIYNWGGQRVRDHFHPEIPQTSRRHLKGGEMVWVAEYAFSE